MHYTAKLDCNKNSPHKTRVREIFKKKKRMERIAYFLLTMGFILMITTVGYGLFAILWNVGEMFISLII